MIANIINPIFELNEKGERSYTTAYIQLAKGNMKSTLGAALAIYFLVVEGAKTKGFQVWAIAASRAQAGVVFTNARRMVEASPYLLIGSSISRDALFVASTNASFRVSSSDAPKKHGVRPNVVICDELHAHENGELYEAFQSAMITATRGLMFVITNPGSDENNSKCGEVYRLAKSGEDPEMYFWAPEVPDDKLNDPKSWKMANPASFITVDKLVAQSKRMPPFAFQRWHLGRWTRSVKEWLLPGAWEAIEGDVTLIDGETIVIGVDMARRFDSAAIVIVAPRDGKMVAVCETWATWTDPSRPPPKVHHVIENEDFIPINLVMDRIRELRSQYNVVSIPYDPWRITDMDAENLMAEGFPMVRVDQNLVRMAPICNKLFTAVNDQSFVHGGDPFFTAQIEAAVVKDYGNRGWKFVKDEAHNFMDATIALALAIDEADEWANVNDPFEVRYF